MTSPVTRSNSTEFLSVGLCEDEINKKLYVRAILKENSCSEKGAIMYSTASWSF